MPLSPQVLPGRAYQQVDRKSRALFHWRAADLSLTAITGEVLTLARASVGMCRDTMGIWRTVGQYQPRWHYYDLDGDGVYETPSLLIEGARTNVALWCRDLTNAAWTKTNVTAAKDQTGIDGVAASASKITASAGNGTCLQAVVLGSSARLQSAWVKRVTGTGTIQMTTDGGGTWTAITVTSAWAQVAIPVQTLANPNLGFRIVTNGDAIAVDFVHNEGGLNMSSPILTTTAAATRNGDDVTATLAITPRDMTWFAKFGRPPYADIPADTVNHGVAGLGESGSGMVRFFIDPPSATYQVDFNGGGNFLAYGAGAVLEGVAQVKNLTTAPASAVAPADGVLPAFTTGAAAFAAFGSQTLNIGKISGSDRYLYGGLMDLKIGAALLTGPQMRELF